MKCISYESFCDLAWEKISTRSQVTLMRWSIANYLTDIEKDFAVCFDCCKLRLEIEQQNTGFIPAKLYLHLTRDDLVIICKKFNPKRTNNTPTAVAFSRILKHQIVNFEIAIWKVACKKKMNLIEARMLIGLCSCNEPLVVGLINLELVEVL